MKQIHTYFTAAKMNGLAFILSISVLPLNLVCQNSTIYYPMLQKAEKCFYNGSLDSALIHYDNAFEKFDYPFYTHVKQAAIVAHYSGDRAVLKKYLIKCIEMGMNKRELEFFLVRNKSDSAISAVAESYEPYRQTYAQGIDTPMLVRFLELDVVDTGVNGISYERNGHSYSQRVRQDSLYMVLLSRYVALIDSLGYPTERKVGLDRLIYNEEFKPFQEEWPNSFQFTVKHNTDLLFNKEHTRYWTVENSGTNHHEGSLPGNSFLFHLMIREVKFDDTEFLDLLDKGFDDLKVNPVSIMHYNELKSWGKNADTSSGVYDCGCSYWSRAFAEEARSVSNMARLPQQTRAGINKCRARYYMRTIEEEQKMFERLYRLEYGKAPKKYNKRNVKKIAFAYKTFI